MTPRVARARLVENKNKSFIGLYILFNENKEKSLNRSECTVYLGVDSYSGLK